MADLQTMFDEFSQPSSSAVEAPAQPAAPEPASGVQKLFDDFTSTEGVSPEKVRQSKGQAEFVKTEQEQLLLHTNPQTMHAALRGPEDAKGLAEFTGDAGAKAYAENAASQYKKAMAERFPGVDLSKEVGQFKEAVQHTARQHMLDQLTSSSGIGSTGPRIAGRVPILRDIVGAWTKGSVEKAADKMRAGEATNDDYATLAAFNAAANHDRQRLGTLSGKVQETLMSLPTEVAEWMGAGKLVSPITKGLGLGRLGTIAASGALRSANPVAILNDIRGGTLPDMSGVDIGPKKPVEMSDVGKAVASRLVSNTIFSAGDPWGASQVGKGYLRHLAEGVASLQADKEAQRLFGGKGGLLSNLVSGDAKERAGAAEDFAAEVLGLGLFQAGTKAVESIASRQAKVIQEAKDSGAKPETVAKIEHVIDTANKAKELRQNNDLDAAMAQPPPKPPENGELRPNADLDSVMGSPSEPTGPEGPKAPVAGPSAAEGQPEPAIPPPGPPKALIQGVKPGAAADLSPEARIAALDAKIAEQKAARAANPPNPELAARLRRDRGAGEPTPEDVEKMRQQFGGKQSLAERMKAKGRAATGEPVAAPLAELKPHAEPNEPAGPEPLNDREKAVLDQRRQGLTLEAIGKTLGLTKERVRQVEKEANAKQGEFRSLAEKQQAERAAARERGVEPVGDIPLQKEDIEANRLLLSKWEKGHTDDVKTMIDTQEAKFKKLGRANARALAEEEVIHALTAEVPSRAQQHQGEGERVTDQPTPVRRGDGAGVPQGAEAGAAPNAGEGPAGSQGRGAPAPGGEQQAGNELENAPKGTREAENDALMKSLGLYVDPSLTSKEMIREAIAAEREHAARGYPPTILSPEAIASAHEQAKAELAAEESARAAAGKLPEPTPGRSPAERSLSSDVGAWARDLIRDEGGAVNLDRLRDVAGRIWQQLTKGAREFDANFKELKGKMFPRMDAIHPEAADKTSQWVATNGFVKVDAPRMIDKVLEKATPAQDHVYGTVFQEARHRHAIAELTKEAIRQSGLAFDARRRGDQEAATKASKAASDAAEIRSHIVSFIGKQNSPLATEADFLKMIDWQKLSQGPINADTVIAAALDPGFKKFLENYRGNMVPRMEDNFRKGMQMEDADEINSLTQIPGLPLNANRLEANAAATPGTIRTGPSQGNLRNPRVGAAAFSQQAHLSGDYDTRASAIIENSLARSENSARKAEAIRAQIEGGVSKAGAPGQKLEGSTEFPGTFSARDTRFGDKGDTSLYVHDDAAPEWRKALNVDAKHTIPFITPIMNWLTSGSLMSTVEAAYHSKNLLTSLMAPGMSPIDLFSNTIDRIRSTPGFMDRIIDLASIGAQKDAGAEGSKLNPLNWTQKLLHGINDIMRVTLDDAFKRNASWKRMADTEGNRRDFINQWSGQYNKRAQQSIIALVRDLGIGPFATAASQFAMGGLRSLTGSPGAKATSTAQALGLRAEMIAKTIGLLAATAVANINLWGRPDGDDNVPMFALKLGDDGKGHTSYINLTNMVSPFVRGVRETGALAMLEGQRRGQTAGKTIDRATHDVETALLHPFLGPAAQFGKTVMTGENSLGRKIADEPGFGESKTWKNFQAALWNENPTIASLTGTNKPSGQEAPASERGYELLGPFGPRFAGPYAPQEVQNFREAMRADEAKYRSQVIANRKMGQPAKEPPVLRAMQQGAMHINKLERAINRPETTAKEREEYRQRQKDIASAMMQRRERVLAQ